MPLISVNDIELYYERFGDPADPPLLMIAGLTDYTAKCEWQIERLADLFDMVVYDNRGGGRSTQPPPGYTMSDLANDAVGLMDALDIASAYIFGFSMGGMIALNLALDHPQRVRRLALGCTSAGGSLAVPPKAEVAVAMTNPEPSSDPFNDYFDGAWLSLSQKTLANQSELVAQLAEIAATNPQTPQGYAGQIQAVLSHDVSGRLEEITMPVLVMHGEEDLIIPVENGRLLAENIPNAQWVSYPEAGHLFFIERQADVNRRLLDFFLAGE